MLQVSGRTAQSCLMFELLACSGVRSLTFDQLFESLLRSLHVITHTATQALQPRTGASSEEIEEENSERMEKQLLLWTPASTVRCKHVQCGTQMQTVQI